MGGVFGCRTADLREDVVFFFATISGVAFLVDSSTTSIPSLIKQDEDIIYLFGIQFIRKNIIYFIISYFIIRFSDFYEFLLQQYLE